MGKPTELLQGTLDLLILKTLALEPMHGWGITLRIQQITGDVLQVRPGALYPALHRLEHQGWILAKWGETRRRTSGQVLLADARRSTASSSAKRPSGAVCRRLSRHSSIPRDRHAPTPASSRVDGASVVPAAQTVDQELDEELQFHLEQMQELAVSRGDDPAEARWRARRHMGSVDHVKEACRDMRTLRPLEHFLHDLRFGARLLARGRGFTAVAVVSLALGIGASSSIFSLINAIVLRPLPVADPHELYIAQVTEPHEVDLLFSSPVVERASKLLAGRAEIAAQSSTESVLIGTRGDASPPEAARLQLVAGDFFGTLRQRAQIGRLLGPADNRTVGQHPVAVISDRYWSRRFGRTARVLDTELIINGAPMAIVGVAAPEFFGATVDRQTPDVWAPAAMQAALRFAGNLERTGGDLQKPWPSQPEFAWLQVMIRVPEGGAPAAAEAMTLAAPRESSLVSAKTLERPPVTLLPGSGGFSPIRSELTTPLIVLLLMVGLLLAIACANIASLLLARATSRGREIAIRLSMGAGRGRLIRQLLTESLLLASVGGVLGLALAYWGSTALLTLLTHGVPVSSIDVRPDWRVVSLTFATSIGTALAFGLLPALRGTRVPLAETLKAQTRSVIGTDRTRRTRASRQAADRRSDGVRHPAAARRSTVRAESSGPDACGRRIRPGSLAGGAHRPPLGGLRRDRTASFVHARGRASCRSAGRYRCQHVREWAFQWVAVARRFPSRRIHTGPQRTDDQAFRVGHVRLLPYCRPDDQAGPRLRTARIRPEVGG